MIGRRMARCPPLIAAIILAAFLLLFCDAEHQNHEIIASSVTDEQDAFHVDRKSISKGEENSAEEIVQERHDDDFNPSNESEDVSLPGLNESVPGNDSVATGHNVEGTASDGLGVDDSQASTSSTLSNQNAQDMEELHPQTNEPEDQNSTAQPVVSKGETYNSTTTSEFASSATDSSSSSKSDPGDPTGSDQTSSVPGEDSKQQAQSDPPIPSPPENKPDDPDYLDLDEPTTATLVGDGEQPTTQQTATATTKTTMLNEVNAERQTRHEDSKDGYVERWSEMREDLQLKEEADRASHAQSDKPLATNEKKKPMEDSLAGFLEKVKNEEPDLTGQASNDNTTNKKIEPHGPVKSSEDVDLLEQSAEESQYRGTWGVLLEKRYADIQILGLLFNKTLVADASTRYNKIFEPVDGLVIPTLHSKIMGGELTTDEELRSNNAASGHGMENLADQRSVNTEFVEGLDNFDKFFEGVDPPDELDVGAAGSSIQDVLMGQTSKIIIKRVTSGVRYVSGIFKAGKKSFSEYMENEEKPALKMEHLRQARAWLVARAKDVFLLGKDLYESVFSDEDEVAGDEFLDYTSDLQKKLQDMTMPKSQTS